MYRRQSLPPQPPHATCSHPLHQGVHNDAGTCLTTRRHPPIIVANDGQLSSEKEPSIGVLLADPMSKTTCLQSTWREDRAEHLVVQVGPAAITTGVALGRAWMPHRDVIWFLDSGAARASVVRGKSKCESMDVAAGNTQLILVSDRVRVWFEYFESKATALSEKPHVTPFECRMVFHIGKFRARRGLGANRTVPHLNFIPGVVWSSVGIGPQSQSKCGGAQPS